MHDLIIVGAGPAGLGASIYASRYKLEHLVIGSEIGGQLVEVWEIENYAGFEKISGKELIEKFKKQTEDLGGKIIQAAVERINKIEGGFQVITGGGEKYESKSIIFSLGMKPRKMNVVGEDKFLGKGVTYCATCDAMFYRNKDVAVIGGGNSAATAAIHLSEFANKIYHIYREHDNSITPALREQLHQNSKIEQVCCTQVAEIVGEEKVSGLIYESANEKMKIEVEGVFIEVGTVPGVAIAKELGIKIDKQGYIVVDQTQKTNVEGIYAAGDVTTGSNKFRQVITAVAEGAVAAGSVYRDLKLKK